MPAHSNSSIDTYLERVDARLASIKDDGEKAVFINLCIGQAERKRDRFEETLDPRYGDAIQISTILAGLHGRHADVVKSIQQRISQANANLSKPDNSLLIEAFRGRREGFEIAGEMLAERETAEGR